MRKTIKKITSVLLAATMAFCTTAVVHADDVAVCSSCGHTTLSASVSGPYHYEYTQHDHDGDGIIDCTITKTIGILTQRCSNCGTIVYQEATTTGISHSYN